MDKPEIVVHAFKVNRISGERPLEDLFPLVSAVKLEERNRETRDRTVRLEIAQQEQGGQWLCDFVKIRSDHGPAKASKNRPVEGFDLAEDEGFGEETAMLYDVSSQFALVQYNHYGVRAGAIADYLSIFFPKDLSKFEFAPRFEDDIQRRLSDKTLFKTFSVAIAPRLLNKSDLAQGIAFEEALKFSDEYGAGRVEITITAEAKGKTGALSKAIKGLSQWIVERVKDTEPKDCPFVSAEVAAKDTSETKTEVLDLVAERVKDRQAVVRGEDRRFSRDSRWTALQLAWTNLRHRLQPNA